MQLDKFDEGPPPFENLTQTFLMMLDSHNLLALKIATFLQRDVTALIVNSACINSVNTISLYIEGNYGYRVKYLQ